MELATSIAVILGGLLLLEISVSPSLPYSLGTKLFLGRGDPGYGSGGVTGRLERLLLLVAELLETVLLPCVSLSGELAYSGVMIRV